MNRQLTTEPTFSRMPLRVAQMLLCVVFPLIWVGGLVTTFDAGMAVPDWPNTYNYNMFAYPVRDWFFGPWDLFVEHGHRLLGSLAGILAIFLVATAFARDKRVWFRWVSIGVLFLVIFQGMLGGIRVLQDDRLVAQIHGTVGPGFFALVAAVTVMCSSWWRERESDQGQPPRQFGTLFSLLSVLLFTSSFLQLGVGAAIRHMSDTASTGYFGFVVVLHIAMAVVVAILALALFGLSRAKVGKNYGFRRTSFFLAFLVLIQVGLGLTTWVVKYGWPAWFDNLAATSHYVIAEKSFWQMNLITMHVATGSLILATSSVLMVKCFRQFWYIPSPKSPDVKSLDAVTS